MVQLHGGEGLVDFELSDEGQSVGLLVTYLVGDTVPPIATNYVRAGLAFEVELLIYSWDKYRLCGHSIVLIGFSSWLRISTALLEAQCGWAVRGHVEN